MLRVFVRSASLLRPQFIMKRNLASMSGASAPALVSPDWLADNMAKVKVIDASWYLPAMKRNAKQEFLDCRIPGAGFFDVDATDDTSSLPHMLPSDAFFAKIMTDLGVSSDDHIVCYDGKGLFSSARAWWMLRAFGHSQASVLDGGLPAWQRADQKVESGEPAPPAAPTGAPFAATLDRTFVADLTRVRTVVDAFEAGGAAALTDGPLVVDARSTARFEGTVAEARPNCRSGHAPGSRSLPFDTLLTAEGTMKPKAEVVAAFAAAGIADVDAPLIGSCGSGVTASVLALGLEHAGRKALLEVYDGSWAEYGGDASQPLASGPPA